MNIEINIELVDGEKLFVGKIEELPDVRVYEGSQLEAQAALKTIIDHAHEAYMKVGRIIPINQQLQESVDE